MRTRDWLIQCLAQLYSPANREQFLLDELRLVAEDLHHTKSQSANQIGRAMAGEILDLLDGFSTREGNLSEMALQTLLSLYFPTEDQAFNAVGQWGRMGVIVRSVPLILNDTSTIRHYLRVERSGRLPDGNVVEAGQHLCTIPDTMRVDYLEMLSMARQSQELSD